MDFNGYILDYIGILSINWSMFSSYVNLTEGWKFKRGKCNKVEQGRFQYGKRGI